MWLHLTVLVALLEIMGKDFAPVAARIFLLIYKLCEPDLCEHHAHNAKQLRAAAGFQKGA